MEPIELIKTINWHDLPISSLSIQPAGGCFDASLIISVTPFDEEKDEYINARLTLSNFHSLNLDIVGTSSAKDIACMEVATFDYLQENSLLSGEIGILPGDGGYWKIKFTKAEWSLVCPARSK